MGRRCLVWVVAIALLGVLASGLFWTRVGAQAEQARRAVIIVIDACRPDYLQLGPMPAIEALARDGVSYKRAWVGHLINNTPPGHLTIASGCLPRTTGVVGFGWRDPETRGPVRPTAWEPVVSGEYAELIARSGVPTIAGVLKQARPEAVAAAVGSVKFYAVASMGANTADYIVFTPHAAAQGAVSGIEAGATPQAAGLRPEDMGVRGHLPPVEALEALENAPSEVKQDQDTAAMEMALALVRAKRPDLLMINLAATDGAGHQSGGITAPERMREVVQNADAQIGRLVALYKELGIYDDTVWVVTADHGMIPDLNTIPPAVATMAVRQSGLPVEGKAGRPAPPHIWLSDPSRAQEVAEAITAQHVPEVHAVFYKVKEGNDYRFRLARPVGPWVLPAVIKAFRVLANAYACANGPDVSVFSAENTLWAAKPAAPGTRGRHNTATWGTQHIPLIVAGPGLRRGVESAYPARLCDVAPTVLAALGLRAQGMDGVVLADAFQSAPNAAVEAQKAEERELSPPVEALYAQSQADIEWLGRR